MVFSGRIWKEGNFWLIECELLDAMTQGKTKKEALAMMADWVRSKLNEPDMFIDINARGESFYMHVEDPSKLVAHALEEKRIESGMTFEQIAKKIGVTSRSSVKTTMSGKHDTRLGKLQQICEAMGYELEVKIVKKSSLPKAS